VTPSPQPDTVADTAHRLAARAWALHNHLTYAGVSQEDQDLLFIEVSLTEAEALRLTAYRAGRLNAHFLYQKPGGSDVWDSREVRLTDGLPQGLPMPTRGEVWTSLYGVKLVWLGKK
jgi:hypothetical protein